MGKPLKEEGGSGWGFSEAREAAGVPARAEVSVF